MGQKIALDAAGNVYVVGGTAATNFPTTIGAVQNTKSGGITDVFIAKLNATGSGLIYATYLGGTGQDGTGDIAIDAAGNAYVVGVTKSTDFPVTTGALQTTYAGGLYDIFVAKINPTGTRLAYSTYVGSSGNDGSNSIAVDAAGNVVISGSTDSPLFPTTAGAYQGVYGGGLFDAVITKLNSTGTALVYSTFLGGADFDRSFDLVLDTAGNVYLTGDTRSTDFPVTANTFQTANPPGVVAPFVTKLNPTGSGLVYSTYMGTGRGFAIAVDASGRAYVTGETGRFPTTADAVQGTLGGILDVYLARLNASGSALEYSTYLGGAGLEVSTDIAVDAAGNAYVTGATASTDFPLANPIQAVYGGGIRDGFIVKMTTTPNAPPVASAGAAQTLQCTGGSSASTVLNGSASTDPDGNTLTYAWSWAGGSATGVNPAATFPLGTTAVTLTVDDGNGGTATATTSVSVQDTIAPVVNAGADVTLEATSTSGVTFNVAGQASASDTCCAVGVNISPAGPYPMGATSVTVTGTDCAGNSASDIMVITVQDTTLPILTVPAGMTVEATAALTSVAIGTATATDIFAVTVSSDAPAAFPVGTTGVTWTATDANGNTATGTQTVTVTDTTAPVITAPVATVDPVTGVVNIGVASAVDLVDGAVPVSNNAPAVFPVGTTVVTYTATDAAGNTATATQTVTVTAVPPPPGTDEEVDDADHGDDHNTESRHEDENHDEGVKEKDKEHKKDKKKES